MTWEHSRDGIGAQLCGGSAVCDFSPYVNRTNLVFVDGTRSYG